MTGDQSEPKAHGNEQASTKDGEQAQSPLPPATEILEDTFGQWPDCLSGAYRLMRAGDRRITLTVTAIRRPNPVWHPCTPVQKLFVLPPALRPPFALVRESAVEVLPTGRSHRAGADGDVPAAWSRLQIAPDGSVRYSAVPPSRIRWITPEPAELPAAFHLHAQWGTTPAANGRVVLDILAQTWLGGDGVALPPGMVTLNSEGRVAALRWKGWDGGSFHLALLVPELAELTALTRLDLSAPIAIGTIPPESCTHRQPAAHPPGCGGLR